MVDPKNVMNELRPEWIATLPQELRDRGEHALAALVADQVAEANRDDDPPAIIAIQRKDLGEAMRDKSPAQRVQWFDYELLDRQILRLRARTYALGTAVVDGKIAREQARHDGEACLQEVTALKTRVAALGDETQMSILTRGLNEAMMEALYAVEQKAMSLRLGHYADSKK
jgi:hypothetical protein